VETVSQRLSRSQFQHLGRGFTLRRTPWGRKKIENFRETIALPESVFYMLERVAEVLARGDSITVVPVGREVTTQQAANLLNVSRQYLVRLLDQGRIAFRKTGKHRRLRIEDVLAFKEKRDKDRRAGLRELSQLSQEFGGYDARRDGAQSL
jgi:excisionase family DNA binding protein